MSFWESNLGDVTGSAADRINAHLKGKDGKWSSNRPWF